jgi:adenosine kinase
MAQTLSPCYYIPVQKPSPIVVSGSIAIDRIMSFDGSYSQHLNPEKLDKISISTFLDTLNDAHGGVGANIAYSLALLGAKPILLGSVGFNGEDYMEKLSSVGVDTSHVFKSKLPTASFNVITDTDQNQIGGFYPGATFDSDTISFTQWQDTHPIVVISPQDPRAMDRLVSEAKQWQLRLFYDPSQQVTNVDGADLARGVDVAELLILNEYELSLLSKKTGKSIEAIKKQVPVVVTTQGKDGSIIEGASVAEPIQVGVVQAEQIADPTGAGDAYRAGFLYGYARNWSLKTSAQLGAVCAAYAVEQIGTQTHVFTPAAVRKRYMAAFQEELELTKE